MSAVFFVYAADTWCEECGLNICAELEGDGVDPDSDTDVYPRSCDLSQDGEADRPFRCNGCFAMLGNPLTPDGVKRLADTFEEYIEFRQQNPMRGRPYVLEYVLEDLDAYADHFHTETVQRWRELL